MKILTIVVPSYNTEKYIDECLPTMISDSMVDDIEILLINDGSTDNTESKLIEYQEKYPSCVRCITKENGGHGSVINKGIEQATGKYFKVIDGDDWVKTNALNKLVQFLKQYDVDLVISPYCRYNIVNNKETCIGIPVVECNRIYKFEECVDFFTPIALHSITYSTKLLKENNIMLQEKCFYEDAEYNLYPMKYVNTVMFFDEVVYMYRVGSVTQSVNPANVIRNSQMLRKICDNLICYYIQEEEGLNEKKRKFMQEFVCSIIRNNYSMFLKMDNSKETFDMFKQFDRELKDTSEVLYIKSGNLPVRLLRLNNYLLFVVASQLFKIVINKRGF